MKLRKFFTVAASTLALANFSVQAEDGFQSIFNGKDLSGWDGNPKLWSVKDGAIVGETTPENPAKGNTFLIWTNGTTEDFELRCSFRITPHNDKGFANSGIQYRSKVLDAANWVVGGYQADMEAGAQYSGILYEERMTRGIMAARGEKVVWDKDCKKQVTGSLGKSEEIQAAIKKEDWNDYVIMAAGNHLQHFINGKSTVDVTDECESKAAKSGVLALQLHAGGAMQVEFKNLQLKSLTATKLATAGAARLQGVWKATQMTARGEKVDAEMVSKIKLTIEKETYHVESPEFSDQGTFTVNEAASPKTLDVVTANGDRMSAIYEISGDTMKVCYALGGVARPTRFDGESQDLVLAVYQRQKN